MNQHSSKKSKNSRPEINAGNRDLPSVCGEAWRALEAANNPPFLFRYGDSLARIDLDENGTPITQLMNQDRMRAVLARVAYWYSMTPTGKRSALPPLHVVRDMLVRPDIPLPALSRIVEAPVFAPDGTFADFTRISQGEPMLLRPDCWAKNPGDSTAAFIDGCLSCSHVDYQGFAWRLPVRRRS